MTDQIEVTGAERQAAFRAVLPYLTTVALHRREPEYALDPVINAVLDAINGVRAENAVFHALTQDLRRMNNANLTFDDQARDLMDSYDITPKP
jgi:hypothetical protein